MIEKSKLGNGKSVVTFSARGEGWHNGMKGAPVLFAVALFLFPLMSWAQDGASAPLLAQRFAELSRSTLEGEQIDAGDWSRAIDLLKAARRLDPKEARYARLLVEAELHVGNASGAVEALKAYRTLRPDDRVAQTQLIDLYIGRIETADAKLKYLQLLLGDESLPAAVRSHVAVTAARVQWSSLRYEAAKESVAQALKLNPLNMDALRLRYAQSGSATIDVRVATLLAMLKSNPAQPQTAEALAGQLADAGLTDLSTDWYRRCAALLAGLHQPMSPGFARDYAAELYIADHPQLADSMAGQLLKAYPADMDGLYIVMLSAKQNHDQKRVEEYAGRAVNAALNRLAEARAMVDKTTPTTQPIDSPPPALPDLAAQARTMQKAPAEARDAYVSALGDLAWIELYFRKDAGSAARAIDGLKVLLPQDSAILARLEGWRLLESKKKAEAKVKWSAVMADDPLSVLGIILVESQEQGGMAKAKEDAAKLLSAYPSGLLGAFCWNGVRDLGVQRAASKSAEEVHAQIDQFSRDWLSILEQPRRFYHLRFDPVQVGHEYTEPLIAQVTVRNISDQDLTIGRDGVIHPDLWVDAQLRGLHQRAIPAVAYDQLGDRLILHPGESVSRKVRVDQGALAEFLKSDPAEPIQVSAGVITNPVVDKGGAMPGPAGQRAELTSIFQRNGFPINSEADKQRLFTLIRSGTPEQKVRGIALLGAYVQKFRSDQASDAMKGSVGGMMDVLRKAMEDSDQSVAAWASYLDARLADGAQRWSRLESMARDTSWTKRLLALVGVQSLPVERQRSLAGILAADKDIIVSAYAAALGESVAAAHPATKRTGG